MDSISPVLSSRVVSVIASTDLQLAVKALFALWLLATIFRRRSDPYKLKEIPALGRSRIMDIYRTGLAWRLLIPRLSPYLEEAYYKYSKNGKPFKIWFVWLQEWVYVLPPEYLEKIKNQGHSTLSLRGVVHKFLPGFLDNFVVEVPSKLVNAYLSKIDPLLQGRTDQFLDAEIGMPSEWRRINAHTLAHDIVGHVSGRITFGENLADNVSFREPMRRYSQRTVAYGILGNRLNIWGVKRLIRRFLQWRLDRDLAIVTRFLADEITKRQQEQQEHVTEKPFDCIQWAMEQDLPADQKTPEKIARRLASASAGLISTPPTGLLNLLFDAASERKCIDEVRPEIAGILAEDGPAWIEPAISKMKKLDSFVQESLRLAPAMMPLTGWRLVTSDAFRFDTDFALPNGSILTFPTGCMRLDPDTYDEAGKFDGLRFYKSKQLLDGKEDLLSNATRNRSLLFGYGRQACPGRFYTVRLLKLIIGAMIMRYDIRYAGGDREKPEAFDVEPFLIGDPSIDLEFKARE